MKKQWTHVMVWALLALPAAGRAQVQQTGAADSTIPPAAPASPASPEPTLAVPETPNTPHPASRLIEEIVVTAQKREENIQDVPIAITAFSAEKLEALNVQTAEDLQHVTPGLTITNAAGFNVAYLRGVGTDAFLPGADPSVPFYLDGVPLLGTQGSSDTLGRIERVEVLKGPQGTLFGRNSTGGAISIITPEPTHALTGDVSLDYGNYARRKATAYVNVPLGSQVAASLSAFGITQNNFYTNLTGPIIGVYSWGGRGKLLWDATDNLRFTLAASYQQTSDNGGLSFENTRVAPVFAGILPQDPKADRKVSFDSLSGTANNAQLYSGTTDWKLPWIDVKAIGSFQKLAAQYVQSDFDKSDLPIVNLQSVKQLSKQDTGELQFLSNNSTPFHERFKWVGGFFAIRSSGGFNPIAFDVFPNGLSTLLKEATANGPSGVLAATAINATLQPLLSLADVNLGNGLRVLNYGLLKSEAFSTYFQGTLTIVDSLNLTLGMRLQHENRDLVGSRTALPTPAGDLVVVANNPPTLKSNQASPRVALQWTPFGEGTQFYASAARGYKSPTYNTVNLFGGLTNVLGGGNPFQITPVKAEKVDAYEVGLKTELFEKSLRVNSAVFYTRQKELLTGFVSLESGGIVQYSNVPSALSKGAETDLLWSPLRQTDPGLVFTFAATYLDARYIDYPNGQGYDTTTGLAFGKGGTEPLPARDFSGNRIVRTPKASGNVGLSQTLPVGDGSLELAADGNYSSPFFFLPQDDKLYSRSAYWLTNLRTTYIYDPWGLQLGAYVSNLTNKSYNEVVFVDDFGRNQVLNNPRTFGVRAKWGF